MVNKGSQGRLVATDSSLRPGCFPLGSAQSRAAAGQNGGARVLPPDAILRYAPILHGRSVKGLKCDKIHARNRAK